jgi:hypothetical protein
MNPGIPHSHLNRVTGNCNWNFTLLYSVSQDKGKKVKVFAIHVIWAYRDSRGIAPPILNLSNRWGGKQQAKKV